MNTNKVKIKRNGEEATITNIRRYGDRYAGQVEYNLKFSPVKAGDTISFTPDEIVKVG